MKTDQDEFDLLISATPIQKWVTIPRLFLPEYQLNKGGHVYQTPKSLVCWRNCFAHQKHEAYLGSEKTHKVDYPKGKLDNKLIHDCADLPAKLLENLAIYDSSPDFNLLVFSTGFNQEKKNGKIKVFPGGQILSACL